MKLKESKPKAKKPKTPSRRSSVKKSVQKRKPKESTLKTSNLPDPVTQTLVFETPNKGFRPFEAITPDSSPPAEPFLIIRPEVSGLDREETPSKRLRNSEQTDIWISGIENQTFTSKEFDFPSFPIQY
jgi:hypothetical protein